MKRLIVYSIFFVGTVYASTTYASGVLVETKGPVDVTVAGKKATPKVGLELPDGSKVKAGSGAAAQVMLLDGTVVKLGAGEMLDVGPKAKPTGQRTVIQGIGLAMNEARSSGKGPTVHGMVKMGQPATGRPGGLVLGGTSFGVTGLYPVSTTIEMPSEIAFAWTQTNTWSDPVLVVEDASGKRLIVKPIPQGAKHLTIAASDLGLKAGGSYSWHLGTKQGDNVQVKGSHFPFQILSDADAQSLAADSATVDGLGLSSEAAKGLMQGQISYKYKLYDRMVKILLPIYRTGGGTAIKRLLYVGYLRMGLTAEMEKYR